MKKVEAEYWASDNLCESEVEKLVINIAEGRLKFIAISQDAAAVKAVIVFFLCSLAPDEIVLKSRKKHGRHFLTKTCRVLQRPLIPRANVSQ